LEVAELALEEVAERRAGARLGRARLARGAGARRVLALRLEAHVLGHLVTLGRTEAEGDDPILLVEADDLRRDDLAGLEDVLGLDRHVRADLAAGHEALDALLELDARAVFVRRDDADLEGRALGV